MRPGRLVIDRRVRKVQLEVATASGRFRVIRFIFLRPLSSFGAGNSDMKVTPTGAFDNIHGHTLDIYGSRSPCIALEHKVLLVQ